MNNNIIKATLKSDARSNEIKMDHPYMTDENILKFTKSDYYIKAGKKGSWNVGAFFLSALWLAYRKMYLLAVINVVIVSLSYLIVPSGSVGEAIIPLVFAFVLGGIGNWLYLKHAEKKIEKIMTTYSDPTMQEFKLSKIGGTSIIAPIAILLIPFVIGIIQSLN